MKPIWHVVIWGSASLILFGFNIAVIILANISWWWILFSIIALALGWGIAGAVILIMKLRKKTEDVLAPDVERAKARARAEVLMDEDNPDNFVILRTIIANKGEASKQKSKLICFRGYGTETKAQITIIMDLKHFEKEALRIDNVPEEKIKPIMEEMAENPDYKQEVERILTRDDFGRPIEKIRTISSGQEKKEEQKQEEKKVANAL